MYLAAEENGICTIQVGVTDSGIGISEEQQEMLFNSFQQAESSTSRKFGGTGLGLAISKRIVEMMGGTIWIESELGKGSIFAFTAQVEHSKNEHLDKDTVASDPYSYKAAPVAGQFAGYHLLLAEDVEINREIVLTLLEPTCLDIDCAENGEEALRMFSEAPDRYDMIFMDIQMPVMDGYEATRRIRTLEAKRLENQKQLKQIPIVAMTANVFREDIEKCLAVGMNNHVGKPLNLDEVLEKLNQYMQGRE
jgi:CheY-like chemotaxis protein